MQSQISRLESRVSGCMRSSSPSPASGSHSPQSPSIFTSELEILGERLARVEEKLDKRKPAIRLPNPSLDEVWERLEEVESSATKLADDTLGAVEDVHGKLEGLETSISTRTKEELTRIESHLQDRLTDGIEKIAIVLRKLIAVQRKYSRSSSPARMSTSEKQRLIDDLYKEIEYVQGA